MKLGNTIEWEKRNWEQREWVEEEHNHMSVECEHNGKYYTGTADWYGGKAWDVWDIREIQETELFNKERTLTKSK